MFITFFFLRPEAKTSTVCARVTVNNTKAWFPTWVNFHTHVCEMSGGKMIIKKDSLLFPGYSRELKKVKATLRRMYQPGMTAPQVKEAFCGVVETLY